MKVSVEEARRVVWEDTSDWKEVKRDIVDTTRWSNIYEGIFQHLPTGKYYSVSWSQGATEMQDEGPFEYDKDDIDFIEVEQNEITVVEWVPVKTKSDENV